ncbi:hydroxymethylglutaryl-CoA reductase [Candidatus Daviesbacteria bacterium]|nr:hydroxymethylglutaryl-CoA reductase [Candidatus Daviesbacteria bacterium]
MNQKFNLRDFTSAQKRREFLEKELKINLENIGNSVISEDQVAGRNIENLIGATQIPLGIAGPLKLQTTNYELRTHYIPLATTEGALVASVSRGCKAVTQSGGAQVFAEDVGITRGPVFKVKNIKEGLKTKEWIENHLSLLSKAAESTSHHLKLKKIGCRLVGRNLYARFYYDSTDAMGMNMATIATQQAVNLITKKTQAVCISIAGNFDIDKKPAWLNFISGRGKRIWAEVILSKATLKEVLKTSPQKIAGLVYRKCLLGSIMSGSLGFNAHYANVAAAIFAATGQDLAHVVEASLGITTAEVLENGNLHFSIYLPSLVVGTVGGGTHLPTQKEALEIMKISDVLEYSQVVGAAILAGELSLLASLTEGSLVKAHQKLGRKGK